MSHLRCPECRAIRTHIEGKCQTCGYISSVRESINFLYSDKSRQKSPGQSSLAKRSTNKRTSDAISTTAAALTIAIAYDSGSSGSDSSGGDC